MTSTVIIRYSCEGPITAPGLRGGEGKPGKEGKIGRKNGRSKRKKSKETKNMHKGNGNRGIERQRIMVGEREKK